MADSLFLKGVKDVRNHTGSEMTLAIPPRGGDTHPIRRWYADGNPAAYVSCTVFDVNVSGTVEKLVVETGSSTELQIEHDGNGNFTFPKHREVKKAAVFSEDYSTLLGSYTFPSSPGVKVTTPTPAFDPSTGDISLDIPALTVGEAAYIGLQSSATTRSAVCDSWCLAAQGYTSTWIITGAASWGYVNACQIWINPYDANIGIYSCLIDPQGNTVSCEGTQNADIPVSDPNPQTGRPTAITYATLPEENTPWADGPVVYLGDGPITAFQTYSTVNLSGNAGTGMQFLFMNPVIHNGEYFAYPAEIIWVNSGSGYQVGDVVGFAEGAGLDDVLIAGVDSINS